jgi:hypothetical protein
MRSSLNRAKESATLPYPLTPGGLSSERTEPQLVNSYEAASVYLFGHYLGGVNQTTREEPDRDKNSSHNTH